MPDSNSSQPQKKVTSISFLIRIIIQLNTFSFPVSEYGLCSVSLNNKLYLVGGQSTITDCYNPERDEWTQIAMMKERRMECGAAVIKGCIYVTGGYSYSKGTYLESIERYDPELDCWEIVGNLPSATRSHGCVGVFCL